MSRPIGRGFLLAAITTSAIAIAMLAGAGSASAATGTWYVHMTAAIQTASGLPGDPGGVADSKITWNDAIPNTICATTTWSGIDSPVMMGHIHQGRPGHPENPLVTIDLFPAATSLAGKTSPASGCTLVAPGEILAIGRCPAFFETVLHSQSHPWGAVRGQFSTVGLLPRPCTNIPPDPGPL